MIKKKCIGTIFAPGLFSAIAWAHEGHEHAAVNPLQIEWGLKGASDIANIHPLFVHFPIALLMASVVFYLLGVILKKEQSLVAGKWALVTGTIAAGFTVWSGFQAAGTVPHGGVTHGIMIVHQFFGYGILGLSIALSLWLLISKSDLPQKGRSFFLIFMVVLAGLIVQGADFGGRMVFQHGVGVGKQSVMQKGAVSHEHHGYDKGNKHETAGVHEHGEEGHDHH